MGAVRIQPFLSLFFAAVFLTRFSFQFSGAFSGLAFAFFAKFAICVRFKCHSYPY